MAEQSDTCDKSLNEKPKPWPAVGKRRKESLQRRLLVELSGGGYSNSSDTETSDGRGP
jgi:hypothetical protein